MPRRCEPSVDLPFLFRSSPSSPVKHRKTFIYLNNDKSLTLRSSFFVSCFSWSRIRELRFHLAFEVHGNGALEIYCAKAAEMSFMERKKKVPYWCLIKSYDSSTRPESNSDLRKSLVCLLPLMSSGILNLFTVSFHKVFFRVFSFLQQTMTGEKKRNKVTKEEFRWKRARKRGHQRTHVEIKSFWICLLLFLQRSFRPDEARKNYANNVNGTENCDMNYLNKAFRARCGWDFIVRFC